MQFKDISNYLKKKSYKIKQLGIVIDQLLAAKTKIDIIPLSIWILINTSWYFIYALSLLANKFQLASNI